MSELEQVKEVLTFWLGELDSDGCADQAISRRWYTKDEAFDQQIRERFAGERAAILEGKREVWLRTARGRLATIIVLDQLSRNMYRDTPQMFTADERALETALEGIDQGLDRQLATDERVFFYMPLMHSESLEIQQRCVQLFTTFRDELDGPAHDRLAQNVKYAIAHRDIVMKWGRFPHRNRILGRASTPEEEAFLEQPGSSF